MSRHALSLQATSLIGAKISICRRQSDGTHLCRVRGRRRSDGATCNLPGDSSRRDHYASAGFARRRFYEDVQSRRNRRVERLCDGSRPIDSVVLEEGAMDAVVHDETVREDAMQAIVARTSVIDPEEPARQASEFDQIFLRVSEGHREDE